MIKLTISKSDFLRKPINKALDQGIDLSTSEKRNEFEKDFRESHPDFECHRTLFVKIFKQCFTVRNIDQITVHISREKRYNTKLADELKKQHKERTESTPSEQISEFIPEIQYKSVMNSIKNDHLTVQSTGALFRCLLSPLETNYPEIKLSDDTIEQLGKMWLPSLQRYGSEMIQYIVLPTLVTVVLLGSKVYAGYRIKKEKDSQTEHS